LVVTPFLHIHGDLISCIECSREKYLPNGPYSASDGNPVKSIINITPVPLEVPLIEPVIVDPVRLSKLVIGRMAWYEVGGMPDWTVAFPPGPIDFGMN